MIESSHRQRTPIKWCVIGWVRARETHTRSSSSFYSLVDFAFTFFAGVFFFLRGLFFFFLANRRFGTRQREQSKDTEKQRHSFGLFHSIFITCYYNTHIIWFCVLGYTWGVNMYSAIENYNNKNNKKEATVCTYIFFEYT